MKSISLIFILFPLLVMAQNETCNCCAGAQTDFDFWVGNWKVVNANGSPAGTNSITKVEDGCVLRENWTSAKGGYTGTSVNFYNQQTKQWEQLWVDNAGNHLKLAGHRTDNKMIMYSDEFEDTDGKKSINRITWTLKENGNVNQLWETLRNDEVKAVLFNGTYIRSK